MHMHIHIHIHTYTHTHSYTYIAITLADLKYCDYPTIDLGDNESTKLPFRYIQDVGM